MPAILYSMVQCCELDRAFAAMADPTRREILERLAAGPASVSEVAEPFHLSLPGVLKHVRVLEAARLVTTTKRGRTRECKLNELALDEVAEWMTSARLRWDARMRSFEQHVGATRARTQ
jgi:DNA-binding transcriptional ArsR family regulator